VLLVMAIAVPASAKNTNAPGQNKTWVCHNTHSVDNNPWVLVRVAAGWDNGHDDDAGNRPANHQQYDKELDTENRPDDSKLKAGPIDPEVINGDTCTSEDLED
jgi:hypothetical protein